MNENSYTVDSLERNPNMDQKSIRKFLVLLSVIKNK